MIPLSNKELCNVDKWWINHIRLIIYYAKTTKSTILSKYLYRTDWHFEKVERINLSTVWLRVFTYDWLVILYKFCYKRFLNKRIDKLHVSNSKIDKIIYFETYDLCIYYIKPHSLNDSKSTRHYFKLIYFYLKK